MNRKALPVISLSLLCSVELLAQNWRPTDKEWTDKNNTEQYAAYLLRQRTTSRAIAPQESKSNRTAPSGFLSSTQATYFI